MFLTSETTSVRKWDRYRVDVQNFCRAKLMTTEIYFRRSLETQVNDSVIHGEIRLLNKNY